MSVNFCLTIFISLPRPWPPELSLMFSLMDRIPSGVEPMLQDLETYILQSGLDDMKANADIITTVSQVGGAPGEIVVGRSEESLGDGEVFVMCSWICFHSHYQSVFLSHAHTHAHAHAHTHTLTRTRTRTRTRTHTHTLTLGFREVCRRTTLTV